MKTYKIYTAGKMSGLSYSEQINWRLQLENAVRNRTDRHVIFTHPPHYYRYGEGLHQTEREAMTWDLNQIRDSDIVVVRLDDIGDSVGTHMELGFIEAINQMGNHHIYVIGVGQPNIEHPWLNEALFRREKTMQDAAEYISTYLLQ